MKTVHLDEIEPNRIGESLWKPVRSTLGIRAFGINAYTAVSAGDVLFDEHDETESGGGEQRHEELYFVVSGRARFYASGDELDAAAGRLVFFEDPAERRAARAAEPATTVLVIGGPVGEGYEVAPWEYWFRVERARAQGNMPEARTIALEGLTRYPDDARLQQLADE
jgi:hypothetical protein